MKPKARLHGVYSAINLRPQKQTNKMLGKIEGSHTARTLYKTPCSLSGMMTESCAETLQACPEHVCFVRTCASNMTADRFCITSVSGASCKEETRLSQCLRNVYYEVATHSGVCVWAQPWWTHAALQRRSRSLRRRACQNDRCCQCRCRSPHRRNSLRRPTSDLVASPSRWRAWKPGGAPSCFCGLFRRRRRGI